MKEGLALLLAVAIVAISGRPVAADLIGTTVTGTNTYTGFTENLFDPGMAKGTWEWQRGQGVAKGTGNGKGEWQRGHH